MLTSPSYICDCTLTAPVPLKTLGALWLWVTQKTDSCPHGAESEGVSLFTIRSPDYPKQDSLQDPSNQWHNRRPVSSRAETGLAFSSPPLTTHLLYQQEEAHQLLTLIYNSVLVPSSPSWLWGEDFLLFLQSGTFSNVLDFYSDHIRTWHFQLSPQTTKSNQNFEELLCERLWSWTEMCSRGDVIW